MKKAVSLLLAVILSIACLSGCGIQNAGNAVSTEIDYFKAVYNIKFYGDDENKHGHIWYQKAISKIEYDKTNADIKEFLSDVEVVHGDNDYSLELGDEITLTLSYSPSKAKELGIIFKETSKTYTVDSFVDE